MNRKPIVAAPVLAVALTLAATACESSAPPPPPSTYDPYAPGSGGGGNFASWQNTVNSICEEERVAWSSGLATALTGLFSVPFKPGFSPVPSDSRATDFANAVASLSAADAAYARAQTQDAAQTLNAAKTEAGRAARALNAPSCIALATG